MGLSACSVLEQQHAFGSAVIASRRDTSASLGAERRAQVGLGEARVVRRINDNELPPGRYIGSPYDIQARYIVKDSAIFAVPRRARAALAKCQVIAWTLVPCAACTCSRPNGWSGRLRHRRS